MSMSSTTLTTTTATPCGDYVPDGEDKWYDSLGDAYDCDWYATDSDLYCGTFADDTSNFGMTANEACCVCGGGVNPGTTVTNTTTTPCTDWQPAPGEDWVDLENNACDYYAILLESDNTCNGSENFNRTATEACCVCGGGVGGVTTTGSSISSTTATGSTATTYSSTSVSTVAATPAPTSDQDDGLLASLGLGSVETWLTSQPTEVLAGLAAAVVAVNFCAVLGIAYFCCCRSARRGPGSAPLKGADLPLHGHVFDVDVEDDSFVA